MSEPILLVGAGGHAQACIDVIEEEAAFRIVGLVGQAHERGTEVLGYPVIGTDEDLPTFLPDAPNALITVGHIKNADPRIRLFQRVLELGFRLPSIVSPLAHVSRHANIGAGTIVMHHAVVNAGASVGRNCILNTRSLIEHSVQVGDHCHISTAATLNSGIRIGRGTFVGSGSQVRQCVTIGEFCVIGMGITVLANCPDATWMPVPKDRT